MGCAGIARRSRRAGHWTCAALAAVPADRQADIRFLLHPSVRLLRTHYAVFVPWEALQAGQPVPPAAPDPECLLVRRLAAGVELQRLPATDFAWLEALQAGATLGAGRGLARRGAGLARRAAGSLGHSRLS